MFRPGKAGKAVVGKPPPLPATKGAWAGKAISGSAEVRGKAFPARAGVLGKGVAKNELKGKKGSALPSPQVQPSPQARIRNYSAQLGVEVDSIANSMTDLSVDDELIRQHLERIVRLRINLKMAMKQDQASAQAGKGGLKGGNTKAPKRVVEQPSSVNLHLVHAKSVNWKGLFHEWITSQIGRPIVKGDVSFETAEVQDADGKRAFVGTVTCVCLEDETGASAYFASEEPASTIKDAEQLVAKFAFCSVRPDLHDEAERQHQLYCEGSVDTPAAKRHKTASTGSVPITTEKGQLNTGAQLLLGRPTSKEDVKYDVKAVPGIAPPTYVARVSLPSFDATWYEGEPSSDKKSAENSAAAKFLEVYGDEIEQKKVEQDEKRLRKKLKEMLREKLREKQRQRKKQRKLRTYEA